MELAIETIFGTHEPGFSDNQKSKEAFDDPKGLVCGKIQSLKQLYLLTTLSIIIGHS